MQPLYRKRAGSFSIPAIPAAVDLNTFKVVVVIPAYNEERFIHNVLFKIKQYSVTVVVVNDGSTDRTAEIAQAAGVTVINLPENRGKGAALNAGFTAARQLDPDALVVIDGDGQHLPEELPYLVAPIWTGQAEITIGSRYLGNQSNTPFVRCLGHKVFNLITSLLSGVCVSDSQCGYRAFSRIAYRNMKFHSNGFSVESEMQFIIREQNLKLQEVPVTISYVGEEKRSVFEQGVKVLVGILHLIVLYRPFLLIGLLGLFLVVTGIVWQLETISHIPESSQAFDSDLFISKFITVLGFIFISNSLILNSIHGFLKGSPDARLTQGKYE